MRGSHAVLFASVLLFCGLAYGQDIRGDKVYVNGVFKQSVTLWRDELEKALQSASHARFSNTPDVMKVEKARNLAKDAVKYDRQDEYAKESPSPLKLTSTITKEGPGKRPSRPTKDLHTAFLVDEEMHHATASGKAILDEWSKFIDACGAFEDMEQAATQNKEYARSMRDVSLLIRAMYSDFFNCEMKKFIDQLDSPKGTHGPVPEEDNKVFTFAELGAQCSNFVVCDSTSANNLDKADLKSRIEAHVKVFKGVEPAPKLAVENCLKAVKGVLNGPVATAPPGANVNQGERSASDSAPAVAEIDGNSEGGETAAAEGGETAAAGGGETAAPPPAAKVDAPRSETPAAEESDAENGDGDMELNERYY